MKDRWAALLLPLLLVGLARAREGRLLPGGARTRLEARRDSLDRLPPNLRYYEMMGDPAFKNLVNPVQDSEGVRLVSKWGRGPSVRVTGRDSLVFLSLGSEVAIINMRNPATPRVIAEVQAKSVVAKSVLKDSFLIIGGRTIEIWNVANPADPVFRNSIPVTISDICVTDSLLISVAGDSFRVFSIADVGNPVRLGASGDKGFCLSVAGHYAYVPTYEMNSVLAVVDIQNPANPHRVNNWAGSVRSVAARDSFCYVTLTDPMNPGWVQFKILDIANPLSITERGHIDQAGGQDVFLIGMFAYESGYPTLAYFQIIDVSNPDWPIVVSQCLTAGSECGVWVDNPFGHAYIADYSEGVAVIDINDPVHPVRDTSALPACFARDLTLCDSIAVVADGWAGLRLLDISNPEAPLEIGAYDSLARGPDLRAVAVSDSFAFTGGWGNASILRSVDISNPAHPILAAVAPGGGWNIEAIAIRGTLAYLACDGRFLIYDVANPRAPRLVGSCALSSDAKGLALEDSFAFVACSYPGMMILRISNSANPTVVDSFYAQGTLGIDVHDTLAFLASDSLRVVNVANPTQPFQISSFPGLGRPDDIVVRGNRAYTTSYTADQFVVFDVTDPAHAVRLGQHWAPGIRRLYYDGCYVYAACYDAGLCVFETLPSTGIGECAPQQTAQGASLLIWFEPNPAGEAGVLHFSESPTGSPAVNVHDASGRLVKSLRLSEIEQRGHLLKLSFTTLPSGIYFVSLDGSHKKLTTKVVKR